MLENIELSITLPVDVKTLYKAWLDTDEHSEFTGADAEIDPEVGGSFTAWDGYIEGKNIELISNKKIVQSWRTSEFAKKDKDSLLEILFEKVKEGTKLTLIHTNIPAGQAESYTQGWKDFYFKPMKKYFK